MRQSSIGLWATGLVLLACGVCVAEVKVTFERNEGATAGFRFKDVAAPSKTDAGVAARFSIVAGQRDGNGAEVSALNDGRVPGNDDEPGANFFFNAGTDGGRIVADLGQATQVRKVNTYSWHANTRGPQVYTLYGSDGSGGSFDARPARGVDPEKAGWKRLASVDTRPTDGAPGGQYGVSIADSGGAALGTFRYLLFDVKRTEDQDAFGNTFFSEIDIDDGNEHAPPPPPEKAVLVSLIDGKYEMTIDYTEMPELKPWIEQKLRPTLDKWYPIIVEMLPSEGYTPPTRFSVTFRRDMRGVAATAGTRVMCAGSWFRQNLEGEAVGAVVHELVHVVQQYGRARGGNRNPGWLVEGLTDYIRWFKYEPERLRPRPNPARARYTDSYRTTAAFLNYLVEKHDKDIIRKFNTAMRQGQYTPELWKQYTGKTVDELWEEYVQTLRTPAAGQ